MDQVCVRMNAGTSIVQNKFFFGGGVLFFEGLLDIFLSVYILASPPKIPEVIKDQELYNLVRHVFVISLLVESLREPEIPSYPCKCI